MKWKMATAKPTKITRAATTPRHGLEHYCRDLNGWPRSWMGLEKDLPPGEQLVTLFRPFLEHLALAGRFDGTVRDPSGHQTERLANRSSRHKPESVSYPGR